MFLVGWGLNFHESYYFKKVIGKLRYNQLQNFNSTRKCFTPEAWTAGRSYYYMGNHAHGNIGVCVHEDGLPITTMHKVKVKKFSL